MKKNLNEKEKINKKGDWLKELLKDDRLYLMNFARNIDNACFGDKYSFHYAVLGYARLKRIVTHSIGKEPNETELFYNSIKILKPYIRDIQEEETKRILSNEYMEEETNKAEENKEARYIEHIPEDIDLILRDFTQQTINALRYTNNTSIDYILTDYENIYDAIKQIKLSSEVYMKYNKAEEDAIRFALLFLVIAKYKEILQEERCRIVFERFIEKYKK